MTPFLRARARHCEPEALPSRIEINWDTAAPETRREAWPELRHFLTDPPGACLWYSIVGLQNDPEARSERWCRAKAKRELAAEVRGIR